MNFALPFIALLAYVGWHMLSTRRRSGGYPLPPGPKQRFLIGNVGQLPRRAIWLTFMEWSKLYGPVIHFRIFAKRTIVLNSGKVALDLLERQSIFYSDRPFNYMGSHLAGRKNAVFTISTSDARFKIYRKMLYAGLNPRASFSYRPIQYEERMIFLKNLLSDPDDFIAHIRRNAAAITLKVAYGYQVDSNDDVFIRVIEEGVKALESLLAPGKYMVEFMPFLRFIPDWFPGAKFKQVAKEAKPQLSRIENEPFNWAEKNIETGNYVESFISKFLRPESGTPPDDEEKDIIKWVTGGLYLGGADTTVSILTTFFYLMALHPKIQKRAQVEIDQVAGGRLPMLDDYKSMPYMRAILREAVRWGPVAPIGLPHRVVKDDIYDGYWIPKGATVIANIWAITHDEEIYPNPSKFDPERHLGDHPQADPFQFTFGFGRRICPGAHFAELQMFLNMASILATFNIMKPLDDNGHEYEPPTEFQSTAATIHLKHFPCRIIPRSKEITQMINH